MTLSITVGATLFEFNPAGPCLTMGYVTKTTAKTISYMDRVTGKVHSVDGWKAAKSLNNDRGRYHTAPCHSCNGGVNYPNGYMD